MPTHRASAPMNTLEGVIEVTYYTDPLCCWSWAFEPQWRRLRYEFGGRLCWCYRMAGMIADWRSFSDPLNSVHAPAQLAPHWFHVARLSGMPLDERIWLEDPPHSSYPACLAVSAARLQGAEVAERYLRRVREAVMLERRNVARREVLLALAEEVAADPGLEGWLDYERFSQDLDSPEALEAFREDLKEVRYHGIGRFPTLTIQGGTGPGVLLVGYRPYDVLLAALARAAPGIEPNRQPGSAAEYASYWGRITAREIDEGLARPDKL